MHKLLLLAILALTLTNCTKEAGLGGTSQIVGRVRTILYDSDLDSVATYYPGEQRVYIVFGSDTIYNKDTRTDENGYYRFKYLNTGKYTLFTYSACLTCPSQKKVVKTVIDIAQPKQALNAKELVVKKY